MELRPYQQEDVQKLLQHPAMGVFNEQRTGKTPTSIMVMKTEGVQRLLIVCPASLVYKWAEECVAWGGYHTYVITSAKKFNLEKTRIQLTDPNACVIINYENLRDTGRQTGAWERIIKDIKPTGLIVDEAHRCKERKTANFKAVKKLSGIPKRLYLTGTPAPNKPWEVWALLHFIAPYNFKSYWTFIAEFFEEETLFIGGRVIKQPAKFKLGMDKHLQTILNTYSIMRKRKEVMPWLPEQEAPTIIRLPCTPAQQKYIHDLETTFEVEHINTQSILERLVRIRQICASPAILNLKGESPKIEWIKHYITDYPDKSIIIFSNSTRFIYLVKAYVRCSVITGATPPKERQQHIVSFQNGTTKVLILQTQACKEGLTLDHADTTIFLDTYPPAADYQQARDRMVPTIPENVKSQEIIHLMMRDTYDEQLYHKVAQGMSETDVINDYIKYIKERRNNHG